MTFRTNPVIEQMVGFTSGKPSYQGRSVQARTEQVASLPGRKKALLDAGADLLDLAIAMQETRNLDATPQQGYPYGDCKTQDAANFGIFKQNWWMIRTCGAFPGQGCRPSDFDQGAKLNEDLKLDVNILHASMKKYGLGPPTDFLDKGFGWWWGHRGGQSWYLQRPSANDMGTYRDAVLSIYAYLRSHSITQSDTTRVYVFVAGLGDLYDRTKTVPSWCRNPPWKPPYLQGARR